MTHPTLPVRFKRIPSSFIKPIDSPDELTTSSPILEDDHTINLFVYYFFQHSVISVYLDTWKDRCEDTVQAYDEDMIREMKRTEVEDEVRKQVDVLMREELDLLKIVSSHIFTSQ